MKISKYSLFSGLTPFIILLITMSSCNGTNVKPYATDPDIYVEDTDFKVVGYLPERGFDKINKLELNKLTHLNLAFANPDKDGKLNIPRVSPDSDLAFFVPSFSPETF